MRLKESGKPIPSWRYSTETNGDTGAEVWGMCGSFVEMEMPYTPISSPAKALPRQGDEKHEIVKATHHELEDEREQQNNDGNQDAVRGCSQPGVPFRCDHSASLADSTPFCVLCLARQSE
jgi:hypothetical protein